MKSSTFHSIPIYMQMVRESVTIDAHKYRSKSSASRRGPGKMCGRSLTSFRNGRNSLRVSAR